MQNHISKYLYLSLMLLSLGACSPQQDGAIDIGLPPGEATFTIEASGEPNTYILRNTTPETFLHQWDLGNGTTKNGEVIEVKYPLMGNYVVTLRAFNKGGSATGSQTINVLEDAPFDCETSETYKFLTNCSTKTWRLIPQAGALFVGPDDGTGTTWFATTEDDVELRSCQFNDEWIFTVDGMMTYDSKGDIWGEDYLGFDFECVPTADLGPTVAAWGDGVHNFEIIENEDAADQLVLNGLGAFIGLPKVTNGAEVATPVASTTYDIISMETVDGQDIIVLQVNFGPGIWKFTIAAF